MIRTIKGWMFVIRLVGIRAAINYERARRHGTIIDYSKIFTPNELAKLGEHSLPAPWEQR